MSGDEPQTGAVPCAAILTTSREVVALGSGPRMGFRRSAQCSKRGWCRDTSYCEKLPVRGGVERSWGWGSPSVTASASKSGDRLMTEARWTVLVEAKRADGRTERIEIASLERSVSSPSPDDLGLRLAEAKELLLKLQSFLAQDHVQQVGAVDRTCRCGSSRRLHDYRTRQVDTLFGQVILRQPRWRSCGCGRIEPQLSADPAYRQSRTTALIGGRATPELVRVQAELGARSSFREAARVMSVLLPTGKAANHTGIRRRLARTADLLQVLDDASPHRMSRVEGGPMVIALDGAYIRAVPGFQVRHFEVMVGRVETKRHQARHFAVAPNVATSRSGAVGNALKSRGWLPGRDVTVLSDGDPALVESVRIATGDRVKHILDWFHLSMRVRHVEQAPARGRSPWSTAWSTRA